MQEADDAHLAAAAGILVLPGGFVHALSAADLTRPAPAGPGQRHHRNTQGAPSSGQGR